MPDRCPARAGQVRAGARLGVAHTYREAGVKLDEARRAVALIGEAAARTTTPEVLSGVGGFGSLFRLDSNRWPDPVLVASTDGVGTKLKIAIALDRHDTVGEDLVNHCVNDIAVQGADPLFFLDYFGVGRLQAAQAAALVAGMARACLAYAHITGGGWIENVPRTLPEGLGVEIETGSWPVPRIFTLIQQAGDIPDEEMVRTFNLGIGLTCIVRRSQVETALEALPSGCVVGRVVAVGRGRPRVAFV